MGGLDGSIGDFGTFSGVAGTAAMVCMHGEAAFRVVTSRQQHAVMA